MAEKIEAIEIEKGRIEEELAQKEDQISSEMRVKEEGYKTLIEKLRNDNLEYMYEVQKLRS